MAIWSPKEALDGKLNVCVFEVVRSGKMVVYRASARMERERVVRLDFSEAIRSNEHDQ